MKVSVFIATSVDGFIARLNGALDWLPGADPESAADNNGPDATPDGSASPSEDFGYGAFISTVDALVMGRLTFEQVVAFGAWPYGDRPVVVTSRRDVDLPTIPGARVTLGHGSPAEIIDRLAADGAEHIYVDGGVTIQRFLREGLIDELIIARIPVLIGEGRPLFGSVVSDVALDHQETRSFANGFVQSRYGVVRPPGGMIGAI